MTVFVTAGGTRFHADRGCQALANGRGTQAYRAANGLYGESWYGAGGLDGLYPVAAIPVEALAHSGRTACRVCVPHALALPATGQTYGHRPVTGFPSGEVCARCDERRRDGRGRWIYRPMPWPCTSAVVLGLAPRGGEA